MGNGSYLCQFLKLNFLYKPINCVFGGNNKDTIIFENSNNDYPVYVYNYIFDGEIKHNNKIEESGNSINQNDLHLNEIEHYKHNGECPIKYEKNNIICIGDKCEDEKGCADNAFDFGDDDVPYETPLPTFYFTKSKFFSETDEFTKTFMFSESKKFEQTNFFSKSKGFTFSNYFSKTTQFTESVDFTVSNYFTKSQPFSQSVNLDKIKIFTSSKTFTPSSGFSQLSYQLIVQPSININVKQDDANQKNTSMKIGIGVTCGIVVLAALIIVGLFFLSKRKLVNEDINEEEVNIAVDANDSIVTQNPLNSIMNNDDPFADEFV